MLSAFDTRKSITAADAASVPTLKDAYQVWVINLFATHISLYKSGSQWTNSYTSIWGYSLDYIQYVTYASK
jgi:hypothetical protein